MILGNEEVSKAFSWEYSMERIKEQYGGNCRREKSNKSKREMRKIKAQLRKNFNTVYVRKKVFITF